MRKTRLLLSVLAVVMLHGPASADTNLGSTAAPVFQGHVVTPAASGPRILYAPSESDDAEYRARMAAHLSGTCDYYDARFSTPSVAFMNGYDAVMTWANYAYFDNVTFGNNLADYVDAGGQVILGAFCAYTSGNYLSGRIMTDTAHYCPVIGGFNHFSLSYWDGSCAEGGVHAGITSYGSTYRDYLTLVAPTGVVCGRFQDGEIANVFNHPLGPGVAYANGAGGYPLFPEGQDAERAANAIFGYGIGTPTEGTTWGSLKALYR